MLNSALPSPLQGSTRSYPGGGGLYPADGEFPESMDLDEIRRILEARARLELNRKLQEVNWYLEEQARARENLDRIRDGNEAAIRRDCERVRRQLTVSLLCGS